MRPEKQKQLIRSLTAQNVDTENGSVTLDLDKALLQQKQLTSSVLHSTMTRSLAAEELVNATSEELSTYLQSGALNTQALTHSLDYEGLDIEDWERIKRIHFCLADDVHDFITALPDRVRRIKTEHQRENIHTQGEVRGSINWSATLRTRSEPAMQTAAASYATPRILNTISPKTAS